MARALHSDAQMLELERLLDYCAAGSLGVPDFQREFAWSDQHVVSLLGTIFNGWPAGSLLFVRGNLAKFQLRPPDGAPPLGDVEYVILDGQQRITALYNALRDVGPTVYAIDLAGIEDEDAPSTLYIEDRIRSIKRSTWDERYGDPEEQIRARLMPLSALATPASFFEWRDVALAGSDYGSELRIVLTAFYRERLSQVHRYNFPVVFLQSELTIGDIAGIFEKINRSGLTLSTFDLTVARVRQTGWNLRGEWDAVRLELPLLDDYLGNDGLPLLQAIALRRRLSVRQQAVLEMTEEVPEDWALAVRSMNSAIEFLASCCGVIRREWLPYRIQLVGLAALAMDGIDLMDASVMRWFWGRSFSSGFDAATNSRIVADYVEIRQFGRIEIPAIRREVLISSARSQRSVWGAFVSLLASGGARDLLGYTFSDTTDRATGHDDHINVTSIFESEPPLAQYFDDAPVGRRVMGLALAGLRSTKLLKDVGLVGAVERAVRDLGQETVDASLATQMLPNVDQIRAGRPDDILRYRLERTTTRLREIGLEVW